MISTAWCTILAGLCEALIIPSMMATISTRFLKSTTPWRDNGRVCPKVISDKQTMHTDAGSLERQPPPLQRQPPPLWRSQLAAIRARGGTRWTWLTKAALWSQKSSNACNVALQCKDVAISPGGMMADATCRTTVPRLSRTPTPPLDLQPVLATRIRRARGGTRWTWLTKAALWSQKSSNAGNVALQCKDVPITPGGMMADATCRTAVPRSSRTPTPALDLQPV